MKNEGAVTVISGNNYEISIIRCNTHQVQRHNRFGSQLYIMSHLLMFTNWHSLNKGAVVSGNTDETSIIRCSTHYMQSCNRLGGQLCIISHPVDVH